jgi:N-acetylmuramoyl-L-alanine amidase
MGNFQSEEPTPQQLQATIDLTAWLASTYQIDVYRKVTYHESSSEHPYISNHTDESLV